MASSSSSPSASPPARPLPLPPPPHSSSLPPPVSKPPSPTKRSAPLPWTHQETLALIQAYQEKWYSLQRGQLKAYQWEEVAAAALAALCGFDEPSKTSTQCRHKIEKLRKRYRSELEKPYPNFKSWPYFDLMKQMERGPMPLNALPIAVVKSSSNNANSNSNSSNHGYGGVYSSSADYYSFHNNINDSGGDGGGSDESDEKWNSGPGIVAARRNKSSRVNNMGRGGANSGVRVINRAAMGRGFGGNDNSFVRVNPINGKRKEQYYDGDDSDEDDDDDDEDDHEDDVEEGGEDGVGGTEMAAKIRGFADSFMKMENKKIEMMRETEMQRIEMEKKRTEMILEAQRKIIETITRTFGAHKKTKMAQET